MAEETFTILAFAGSLRVNSYNRGLIRLAEKVAPKGVQVHTFDIATIPVYNEDVQNKGDPDAVREFKAAIEPKIMAEINNDISLKLVHFIFDYFAFG